MDVAAALDPPLDKVELVIKLHFSAFDFSRLLGNHWNIFIVWLLGFLNAASSFEEKVYGVLSLAELAMFESPISKNKS